MITPTDAYRITSHTRALAIIGDPIEHSLTPRIQNPAWRAIGADIVNLAYRVPPSRLETAVRGARALGLLGLMVTIPHKEAVLAFCDTLDESARAMGAANLLHFHPTAGIVGYSTDGWAALKSLEEEGIAVRDARVAMLGGGGAARSLALTLAVAGARDIVLLNRTLERVERIVTEVAAIGATARAASLDDVTLEEALGEADLLINATSIGMHPHRDATPVPPEFLHGDLAVYDIVYNPLETQLLREARAAGAKTVDGLGMLIYTNVRAAQICAGLEISAALMREEALAALGYA